MRIYDVTVITRVKETYTVEAESADEAERTWSSVGMDYSECISVEDVQAEEMPDDY